MSFRHVLRKVLLSFVLGGRAIMGIGMRHEEIEALLHAMNQTRVEVPISKDEAQHSSPIRLPDRIDGERAKRK